MSDSFIWTLLGHLVCIAQWAAFILVDYAYLGRGSWSAKIRSSIQPMCASRISVMAFPIAIWSTTVESG